MTQKKSKQLLWRSGIYAAGLLLLTMGVTLSTKAGLGVSAPESVPYALHLAFGWKFSTLILAAYVVFVTLQLLIKRKNFRWKDLLQIPVSLAVSAFLGWLEPLIPLHFELLWQNLIVMCLSLVLIGFGFAMMVNMDVAPNPPDGLTYAISETFHKKLGNVKTAQDAVCLAAALVIDLLRHGRLVSVGIGTAMAVLLIGRVVSVAERILKKKIRTLAGLG